MIVLVLVQNTKDGQTNNKALYMIDDHKKEGIINGSKGI